MSVHSLDPAFDALLGTNPTIECLLTVDEPLFHEAAVFDPATDQLYVTSNRLIDGSGNQRVQISRVHLKDDSSQVSMAEFSCANIAMGNGGVNYKDGMILCDQGGATAPSALYFVDMAAPEKTQLLISGFYSRSFNSVNDVVVHSDGSIWFTDPTYGFDQGYRPKPQLPPQVYRYVPSREGIAGSGSIRALADGFGHPNGLCFSPDERTLYVTDTDRVCGDGSIRDDRASSIYAFDIMMVKGEPFLANRRLFAMAENGIPDGIKCDLDGNVYSGCGDGVDVWNDGGKLIGKILVEGGIANFCFGKNGEMFLLNETRLWRARLKGGVKGALLGL
jgi:gluconolactonase